MIEFVDSIIMQYDWEVASGRGGVLTTVQAALTTDKSKATVDALTSTGTVIVTPDDGAVALHVRFRGVAVDADSNVVNMYAMRGKDHYTLIATLALTTGTQIFSTGNLFVDTIAKTNEKWPDEITVVSDANNGIAEVALNTHGVSSFLFIATTKESTSVIIETARE